MFELIREDDIWITRHAADKMVVEGISTAQLCEALRRGSKFKQKDGYLCVYGYFSVAYKPVSGKYKIKTVYLNK